MVLFIGCHHKIGEALPYAIKEKSAVLAVRCLGKLSNILRRSKSMSISSSVREIFKEQFWIGLLLARSPHEQHPLQWVLGLEDEGRAATLRST
jgi:hypothetical protein